MSNHVKNSQLMSTQLTLQYQKLINAFKTTQHLTLHSLKYLLRGNYKTQAKYLLRGNYKTQANISK